MTLNGRERGLRMHPMMFFAVLAAYFVKGLSGFANSLVFGSIMNFFTTNLNIVPVDLLLGTPSNLILALHSRREIRWKTALILAAFMTVGTLPGVFLLKNGDDRMLKIVLGILILCLGVEMLTRDRRKAPRERKRWVTWALAALAGMLMGTFGIGAVMRRKTIDMVIHLEFWTPGKDYDRLGNKEQTMDILGIPVPLINVPVRSGRNLAMIVEIAARNWRLKNEGYNAVTELDRRLGEMYGVKNPRGGEMDEQKQ